jgi:TPR repeat protein
VKISQLKRFVLGLCIALSLLSVTLLQAQEAINPNFDAGIAAYQTNNMSLAFKEFMVAAKSGHSDSQYNIGLMYEHGIGVVKDASKAVDWYTKAAAQENSGAQFNLGVLYENGNGTPIDYIKAREFYRKAASHGDALAIGNLGMLYIRGQGVKKDELLGVALLLVSATNDPSPQNNARQNITATRGLSSEMIMEAQTLSDKLNSASNILVPLDAYLEN